MPFVNSDLKKNKKFQTKRSSGMDYGVNNCFEPVKVIVKDLLIVTVQTYYIKFYSNNKSTPTKILKILLKS